VNLEFQEFHGFRNPQNVFDDLPRSLQSSHPLHFEIRTPGAKGIEFKFKPKRLGIFLIRTEWHLRNDSAPLASNPVVLVVNLPATAEKGKPVNPEWLVED
jgi:hypothetical protein